MANPLFSVVTVTLNCADAAVATAQTVLAQTYPNVEYIVKDGGSNDGTPERLRALGVERVHVSRDRGIYDAMNQALDLCSGEYVYFLNAGDTFAGPDVLAEVARRIDTRAAIVYGELMLQPMGYRTRHPERLSRYYLFRKNMNHQAWIARRDLYLRLGKFDTRYRWNADQDIFWKTVLREGLPTQHLDLTLANFVYGGASTARQTTFKVMEERWGIVDQYYSRWERLAYGLAGLTFLNPLKKRIWYMRHKVA